VIPEFVEQSTAESSTIHCAAKVVCSFDCHISAHAWKEQLQLCFMELVCNRVETWQPGQSDSLVSTMVHTEACNVIFSCITVPTN